MNYELIAIGTSWGGLQALSRLLSDLPAEIGQPIVIAQHRAVESPEGALARLLEQHTDRVVRDAEDKDTLEPRHVYLAPPDYHLLVEAGSLALSTEDAVQFARPSIDVMFETAADAYGERAIGIVLTGANDDGARGVQRVKSRGGLVVVQDPDTAEAPQMPRAAIEAVAVDQILRLDQIASYLVGRCAVPSPT